MPVQKKPLASQSNPKAKKSRVVTVLSAVLCSYTPTRSTSFDDAQAIDRW